MLDSFVGLDGTVIAIERISRRAQSLELNSISCDTVIRRRRAFAGKRATHAETGYCFQQGEDFAILQ